MSPTPLDTSVDRIYAAASRLGEQSFPQQLVAAFLAPAEGLLWMGNSDARFENADKLHRLSACILNDGMQELFLGVVRPSDGPKFERSEIGLFESLVPHLRRATRMHRELTRADMRWRQVSGVLDRLNAAVVVLDTLGSIVCANRRADEIFASRETVVTDVGRLRMAGGDQEEELEAAITRAISINGAGPRPPATMMLIRRHGRTPLFVLVLPLRACSERIARLIPAAVLIISDPERDEPSEAILAQLYGLTRAEAVMLRAVLTGAGLQRAAARLKVSPNTAKTHLARILAKTAAGGQGELIRLIYSELGLVRWD
jgi:DNA-binding CsgD family transcriptional regulator